MKELRPYQKDAITALNNSLYKGEKKSLICMGTGLGKTFTAVKACEQLNFERALWITHRDNLCSQSALSFIRDKFDDSLGDYVQKIGYTKYVKNGGIFAGSNFKMGLIKGDVFKPSGNITISSTQTLPNRLHLLKPDQFDFIFVDECHWGTKLVQKSLDYFTAPRCGLSATPFSKDGVTLSSLYNEVIFEYNLKEGIRDKWLCELDGIRIQTNLNLDSVHTVGGEFNQRELADEVNTPQRNALIVRSYLKYSKGLRGIFFCVDIQHCLDLLEVFIEAGINARAISSKEELTGDAEETLRAFNNFEFDVIINVEILTTGADCPDIGVIGLARPTKSIVLYLQSLGRGTRLKSDEFVKKYGQKCILLDFVDQTSKHNLINTFTLDRGLDPEERVFITSEKREKLIEARRIRIEGKHDKDERIQLLPILTPKFKTTIKSEELATQPQLDWLRSLGYDVDSTIYTKENAREILGSLPAKKSDILALKSAGFDVTQPITRNQASFTLWMYNNNKLQKLKQK